MLLQQIVSQLDAELDRLRNLRAIVAALAKSPVLVKRVSRKLDELLQAKPEARPAPAEMQAPKKALPEKPVVERRKAERPEKAPKKRAEPVALSRALSAGPVVISAQALAQERERRTMVHAAENKEATPQVTGENAESLARDLTSRWLTGRSSLSAS